MSEGDEKATLKRGPHNVRIAAMRARITSAAIEALYENGYAATTTSEVQRRAGISRGALLHHFPTKVDLMLETARCIVDMQTRAYDQELQKVVDKKNLFLIVTRVAWGLIKQPSGMALLEIMLASRSDAELGRRFPDVAKDIEVHQYESNLRLARAAGISDDIAVKHLNALGLAALRGLSIQLLYTKNSEDAEAAFEMYMSLKSKWIDEHRLLDARVA